MISEHEELMNHLSINREVLLIFNATVDSVSKQHLYYSNSTMTPLGLTGIAPKYHFLHNVNSNDANIFNNWQDLLWRFTSTSANNPTSYLMVDYSSQFFRAFRRSLPQVFLKQFCSEKFRQFYRKTTVSGSLLS